MALDACRVQGKMCTPLLEQEGLVWLQLYNILLPSGLLRTNIVNTIKVTSLSLSFTDVNPSCQNSTLCGSFQVATTLKWVLLRALGHSIIQCCHNFTLSTLYSHQWFTDYLSDLCEDEHLHRYLDIRVFLTNCDSAPDELASALLQLGLKTAGDKVTVRRPSQPQLNNLYHMTSYGLPDFTSLLDCKLSYF